MFAKAMRRAKRGDGKWLLADNFSGLHFDRANARDRGNAKHFRDRHVNCVIEAG